jgi:hypothetical protein
VEEIRHPNWTIPVFDQFERSLVSCDDDRLRRKPLGYSDVGTTMIYTHVAQRGALGARSPLDGMN